MPVQTGEFDRGDLISMLFRETDRAQRTRTPLALIAFCIVELARVSLEHGPDACNDAIQMIVERATRLLRSYDILGRFAFDRFLLVLPGCPERDALLLLERLRNHVFDAPFPIANRQMSLSATFAAVSSNGRSPIVVLREIEGILKTASEKPGSVRNSFSIAEGDDVAAECIKPPVLDYLASPRNQRG